MAERTKWIIRESHTTYVDKVFYTETKEEAIELAKWVSLPDNDFLGNMESDDIINTERADNSDELTPIDAQDRGYIEKMLFKADEGDESIREHLDMITAAYASHIEALGDSEPVEPLEARQVAYVYPDADVLAIADDNSTFSMVLNVDSVLDCERDEPVPEAEQKLIDICKQAKAQGIGDIIIGG